MDMIEEVKKLVESGSFSKLYGKLLANKKQVKTETTDGIWIKYKHESEDEIKIKIEQGEEPEYIKLYNSLQGYNTGWCTAGSRETAKKQLLDGDFYVYYSCDKDREYKIPRLAIRMNGNQIGEIRGIAENQNIESNMELILEEKLKEFPDAGMYKKRVSDMKLLTNIYNKYLNKEELTKDELRFLYELDELIYGFGYRSDPRIKEILDERNKLEDLMLLCECDKEQIIFDGDYYTLQKSAKPIKYFYGGLWFDDVTDEDGLVFPEIMCGDLCLTGFLEKEKMKLPRILLGELNLGNFIISDAKQIDLPEIIDGTLHLWYVANSEGLKLPKKINGDLHLWEFNSLIGIILSEDILGHVYIYGGCYTLEQIKEMQREEIENKKNNKLKLNKKLSSGIVSISFLLVTILSFCILTFFVCKLILNK